MKGIQMKLGAIFVAYLLLGLIDTATSFWVVAEQRSDGHVMNLAGQLRFQSQRMAKEALLILMNPRDSRALENFGLTAEQYG